MSDLAPRDQTHDAPVDPSKDSDVDRIRSANDFVRLGVVLANGALAACRSADVPPRFRLAYRLGVAALTGATVYAQELPSYTGRRRQVGVRAMAGISVAAAAATFVGFDWVDRADRATDSWLLRRGVRNPQALTGLATVALTGAATVAQDYLPADDDVDGVPEVEVPLPDRIRAALTAVLSGLEDRDPASAAALHQQLDAAVLVVPEGVDVDTEDLTYIDLNITGEGLLRAVPHEQTLSARGHFRHSDRDMVITVRVFDGLLEAVVVDDPATTAELEALWAVGTFPEEDDVPFTLADWPAPEDITVVFDDAMPE